MESGNTGEDYYFKNNINFMHNELGSDASANKV